MDALLAQRLARLFAFTVAGCSIPHRRSEFRALFKLTWASIPPKH